MKKLFLLALSLTLFATMIMYSPVALSVPDDPLPGPVWCIGSVSIDFDGEVPTHGETLVLNAVGNMSSRCPEPDYWFKWWVRQSPFGEAWESEWGYMCTECTIHIDDDHKGYIFFVKVEVECRADYQQGPGSCNFEADSGLITMIII